MFKNIKIYNQNLLTKAEKKTFESKDSFDVMQRAADACSKYIFFNYKPKRILVLCGPGNNGGDGILIAKNLLKQKCHVSIFAPLGYGKSKDSIKALDKLNNKNVFEENFEYRDFDFFIDALFGFNFNKKLSKDLKKIFKDINSQKFTKISIDIPSGVYCDNGQIDEIAIQADITLTFHRLKPAHVLLPGKEFSKKIEILEIGLTNIDSDTNVSIIDKPIINPPAINEHKYNRGELFIIASDEMVGATKLATLAASQIAFKSGTGIVKLLLKKSQKNFYKTHILEELLITYSKLNEIENILQTKKDLTVLFGCGLEINEENSNILKLLLKMKIKLVLDASSFSIIEKDIKNFMYLLSKRSSVTILTPHLGEFKKIFTVSNNKIEDTKTAAHKSNSIVLFKGNDTVISSPTGETFINYFSSPFLATAGSGDVLSGIIASFLAQNYDPIIATTIACYVHSQSAIKINKPLTAKDIIDVLPSVIQKNFKII